MKKTLSTALAVLLCLSCLFMPFSSGIVASAASFTTAGGVQVEIADFLYKSTLHPMEFPSHGNYEVKEKSNAGDYAISGKLNDLAYTFVFPAGTTAVECLVSVDGETNWRGFNINCEENPSYWEKDDGGNVDLSKPLTFIRNELTAERDEYGVLYRDILKDKNIGGYKDIDKIYWKLNYTLSGKECSEIFDIKLYDYDKSEKHNIKAVNFNVAGLPFAFLDGMNVIGNQKAAGEYFTNQGFDIVAVQEDFTFHNNLVRNMKGFAYSTNHTGGIPGGDGLNIYTKNMPIYNENRVEWNQACGILSDGSDELTPKGFVYTVIDVGNGIYVDFYNLHADAYGGEGSIAARTSQYKQLAEFIQARSAENGRPVIVTGDFNCYMHTHEDNGALYNILYQQCGLKDAWIEYHNDGDYFNLYRWHISGFPAWGNWDSVERFMYKGGSGVDIIVDDFRFVQVRDNKGNIISDHSAAECDFTFVKTSDFEEKSQGLQTVKASGNNWFNFVKWIITDLVLVFTDMGNISELFK